MFYLCHRVTQHYVQRNVPPLVNTSIDLVNLGVLTNVIVCMQVKVIHMCGQAVSSACIPAPNAVTSLL